MFINQIFPIDSPPEDFPYHCVQPAPHTDVCTDKMCALTHLRSTEFLLTLLFPKQNYNCVRKTNDWIY